MKRKEIKYAKKIEVEEEEEEEEEKMNGRIKIKEGDNFNDNFDNFDNFSLFTKQEFATVYDKLISLNNVSCPTCKKTVHIKRTYDSLTLCRTISVYCRQCKYEKEIISFGLIANLEEMIETQTKKIEKLKEKIIINKNQYIYGLIESSEAKKKHNETMELLTIESNHFLRKFFVYLKFIYSNQSSFNKPNVENENEKENENENKEKEKEKENEEEKKEEDEEQKMNIEEIKKSFLESALTLNIEKKSIYDFIETEKQALKQSIREKNIENAVKISIHIYKLYHDIHEIKNLQNTIYSDQYFFTCNTIPFQSFLESESKSEDVPAVPPVDI